MPPSGICLLCWVNHRFTPAPLSFVWTPAGSRLPWKPGPYCPACQAHCRKHGALVAVTTEADVMAALVTVNDDSISLPHEPNGEELTWGANLRDGYPEDDGEGWKRGDK